MCQPLLWQTPLNPCHTFFSHLSWWILWRLSNPLSFLAVFSFFISGAQSINQKSPRRLFAALTTAPWKYHLATAIARRVTFSSSTANGNRIAFCGICSHFHARLLDYYYMRAISEGEDGKRGQVNASALVDLRNWWLLDYVLLKRWVKEVVFYRPGKGRPVEEVAIGLTLWF